MQEPFRNKKSRSYRLRPASGRDRLDSRVRRLCSRLGILAVVVAVRLSFCLRTVFSEREEVPSVNNRIRKRKSNRETHSFFPDILCGEV